MKYCPECYKELPPNSVTCPFCGYKTGNGDEDDTPKGFLKTPKIDSYIPPEQTILSLLLIIIFFWGINISIAALPIFLSAGTTRNILIAAISSQVLTRALIGTWAAEEVSLKKDASLNKRIGAFLLAFVPIGDIFSSLNAAKTAVRKNRLSILSTASIAGVLIMSLILYTTSEQITALINGESIAPTPDPAAAVPDQSSEIGNTLVPEATPTTQAYINGCRNPLSITAEEEGDTIEVCGKITNFGIVECDNCPLGFYSWVKLDGSFQIVSYEWRFTYLWLGRCVAVEDEVELLGDLPIFHYKKFEGCTQDECTTDGEGGLLDDSGIYFQPYDNCQYVSPDQQ